MSNVPPPPPPGYGGQRPQYGSMTPGYGAPGYGAYGAPGYPPNAREHPDGTTVLVLGILGLVVGFACGLGFVMSPIAWVKGNTAKKQMDAHPEINWINKGNITAGRICGIIGTVILALGVALVVVFVAIGIATQS